MPLLKLINKLKPRFESRYELNLHGYMDLSNSRITRGTVQDLTYSNNYNIMILLMQ